MYSRFLTRESLLLTLVLIAPALVADTTRQDCTYDFPTTRTGRWSDKLVLGLCRGHEGCWVNNDPPIRSPYGANVFGSNVFSSLLLSHGRGIAMTDLVLLRELKEFI
jgi:hypothetical protein